MQSKDQDALFCQIDLLCQGVFINRTTDMRTKEKENINNSCSHNTCNVSYKSLMRAPVHVVSLYVCVPASLSHNVFESRTEVQHSWSCIARTHPFPKWGAHNPAQRLTVDPKLTAPQGQNHHFCLGRRDERDTRSHYRITEQPLFLNLG